MKVSICSSYEYMGKKKLPPEETFDLTVEGEGETPEEVASTYLKLRGILRKGIGKEGS